MNTIQQINTNQNLSFGKLYKIHFPQNLEPNKNNYYTKVLHSINKSEPLSKFFEQYDVIADVSINKKYQTGFINFYISKINKMVKYLAEEIKPDFNYNRFRLINVISTYNYQTLDIDIENIKLEDLLNKAEKKSKKLNITEKNKFDDLVKDLDTKTNYNNYIVENESSSNNFTGLSDKSKKILKQTNNTIEEYWASLRSKDKSVHSIEFKHKNREYDITLKPLYKNMYSKILLLELDSKNEITKLLIDSNNFDYKYEKIKKTKFGSATIKKSDSKVDKDSEINNLVDFIIETYLPKINKKYEQKHVFY